MEDAMWIEALVSGLLFLGGGGQDEAKGERVFNSRCAACHFAPDLSIRRDQLWVQMIKTTA
jgi:cytochrome c2